MKTLYSIISKLHKPSTSAPRVSTSNKTLKSCLAVAILTLLVISACSPDISNQTNTNTESTIQQKQQEVTNIEENIKNSHALVASERADVCPKLIQKEVDDSVIKRSAEVMTGGHCDYYLYPENGQSLTVNLNSDQIEALLIVPKLHNFADGSYQVVSYDKHVIRLAYKGASYKTQPLNYDVEINVND